MPTDGDDVYYGNPEGGAYTVDLGLGADTAYISSGRVTIHSGAYSDEWEDYGFEHDVLYADFSTAQAGLNSYTRTSGWFLYQSAQYLTAIYEGTNSNESTFAVFADTFAELHVTGSAFDDYLVGGPSNDFYFGGDGNDTFTPRLGGDDVLHGGAGFDWLILNFGYPVLSGVRIDLGTQAAQALPAVDSETYDEWNGDVGYEPPPGTVVVRSIENVQGTELGDNFIGNAAANQLLGMAGDDRLVGNAGNDVLDGGTGIDTMRGGLGNDTYYVDNIGDAAIEDAGEGIDLVYSSVSSALRAHVENLTLTGSGIRGNGNNLANRIIGNDGNNIINGGLGADSLRGGAGNDIYYVDNIGDRVVESAGEGVDRVYSTATYSATLNVEQVFLRGSAAIDAYGNGLDNVLVGNSAANVLNGRIGADDLRGAGGADTFYFDDRHFGGLNPSTCDRIIDFSHSEGDRIDLGDVDASTIAADDQAFAFLGTGAFTNVAGELRYQQAGGNTYVYGDTNGDGAADFMIRLDGSHTLIEGDFIL